MIAFYYYLILFNAALALVFAAVVYWRNRFHVTGVMFGLLGLALGLWLGGFAHYYCALPEPAALLWARITLTFSVTATSLWFHTICTLTERRGAFWWWIGLAYVVNCFFLVLLWQGDLVTGLKQQPFMDHYIHYNRRWYPWLMADLVACQWFGAGVLIHGAWKAVGYKRNQLIYFTVTWLILFLTTHSIILPLEYDFNIQPFLFFLMPFCLMWLTNVMARARLADFNVVVARALIYAVTLTVIAAVSLLFIALVSVLSPGFMNQQQEFFMLALVVVSGLALASLLPRLLPRAERMMQERMFRSRYGYQDALAGLVKDLSRLPNLDLLVWTVTNTIHTQMQVSHVIVFLQDTLSGDFRMSTQSGLNTREAGDVQDLREHSAIVRWLQGAKDILSRDELLRRLPPDALREIEAELKPLKASVCIPMMLEDRLVGLMVIGEKLNKDMFFISDLKLLETLATEVAMAVKYRRMEEEMFHKNKLAELGAIAAGVAHEIRNPLSSIRTFAQLLPHRVEDAEFKYEFSKMVLRDVDRITKVVESMLTFSRPTKVTIGDYPASELVEESILLVQPRLTNKHVKLTKHYHEQPVLKVDKQQIVQVLLNLLNNAIDVLSEDGRINVAVGVETAHGGNHANAEKVAVIEVSDNGPGIPTAIRARVFDPFFTTKKEGTGLGLSISQKILRDHGGIIIVSSVEGKGTTFHVRLPLR